MKLSDFDFELPEELIALRPARPRDAARLLHVPAKGALADRGVRDLPDLLHPGDVMVFNDTRVMPAALSGTRPARDATGQNVAVSVNLHQRDGRDGWRAFVKPGKRLREGDILQFGAFSAEIERKTEAGDVILRFDLAGDELDAAIEATGTPPLPPYIASKREVDAADADDYQTIYADDDKSESVAAPTAGLHFTDRLMDALKARGVLMTQVTLHVGAGTFLPVKTENVAEHQMHSEWCEISNSAAGMINAAMAEGRRVIPVGTTALRTIESMADKGRVKTGTMDTDIFITPGYQFQITDALMTNFHLPKSTLFMLVSALAGLNRMQVAYAHAIKENYRFFSYGDSSLIERAK